MESENFYSILSTVRNSMMNVIATNSLFGKHYKIEDVYEAVVLEMSRYDVGQELFDLTEEELFDLGFEYLDRERGLMLIPVWIVPFIPRGTNLVSIDGSQFIVGYDDYSIHNDHWVDFGFYP
jgi:hypothetical protein